MPTIKIRQDDRQLPFKLRGREIKLVKRILECIKGAKLGVMPGDKPALKASNFLACAPDEESLLRRQQVIAALNIQEFYYKNKPKVVCEH